VSAAAAGSADRNPAGVAGRRVTTATPGHDAAEIADNATEASGQLVPGQALPIAWSKI
jgi:hypothetical protein